MPQRMQRRENVVVSRSKRQVDDKNNCMCMSTACETACDMHVYCMWTA